MVVIDFVVRVVGQLLRPVQWFLKRAFERIKTLVGRWLLSIIAVLAVAALIVRVPQIGNPIFQAPRGWGQWLGFLLLAGGYGSWIFACLIRFWKPHWRPRTAKGKSVETGRLSGTIGSVTDYSLNGLLYLVKRERLLALSDGIKGYLIPVTLIGLALAYIFLCPHRFSLGTWWPLTSAFLRMMALVAVAINAWLIFGKYFDPAESVATIKRQRDPASDPPVAAASSETIRRELWRETGQVITLLTLALIVGELCWIAANSFPQYGTLRLYSVWAFFTIAGAILLVAVLVDNLHTRTNVPWRLLCVLGIAAIATGGRLIPVDESMRAGFAGLSLSDRATPVSSSPDAPPSLVDTDTDADAEEPRDVMEAPVDRLPTNDWMAALENRLDHLPPGPAVMVAASGGGSRAGLFAALVLEHLHRTSMPPLDRHTPPKPGSASTTIGDSIWMISSVSGGSFASARYTDFLLGCPTDNRGYPIMDHFESTNDFLYTSGPEWLERTLELLADDNSNGRQAQWADKLCQQIGELEASGEIPPEIWGAVLNRRVDEMGMDFMAPMYRGALTPGRNRGEALYDFWGNVFGWDQRRQLDWFKHPETLQRRLPLLMVNATDIDHGRRCILGFPPLPPDFFPPSRLKISANDEEPSRKNNYGPVNIRALSANVNVTLGRAVRLSSSFPFGFRPSVLKRVSLAAGPKPSDGPEIKSTAVHFLDGGIVDNTGIDSLHAVLETLQLRALSGDDPAATRIYGKLRQRGLWVIEIDSGARPGRSASGQSATLLRQPIAALSWANFNNSLRASDRYLDDMVVFADSSDGLRALETAMGRDSSPETPAWATELFGDQADQRLQTSLDLVAGKLPFRSARATASSVYHHRISCVANGGESNQVMTALALGPKDKAQVLARFLIERERMNEVIRNFRADSSQAPRLQETRRQVFLDLVKAIPAIVSDRQKPRDLAKAMLVAVIGLVQQNQDYFRGSFRSTAESDDLGELIEIAINEPQTLFAGLDAAMDVASTDKPSSSMPSESGPPSQPSSPVSPVVVSNSTIVSADALRLPSFPVEPEVRWRKWSRYADQWQVDEGDANPPPRVRTTPSIQTSEKRSPTRLPKLRSSRSPYSKTKGVTKQAP